MNHRFALGLLLSSIAFACSEEVGSSSDDDGSGGEDAGTSATSGTGGRPDVTEEGEPLAVPVTAGEKTYVDLDTLSVLDLDDAAAASTTDWDLAFEGYDILTNSGVSGPGQGGAFGPFDPFVFLADEAPEAPFLLEDRNGGAFLRWYAYEGQFHALWSRYHIYGVRDGDRHYKVQILGYYGEIQGAPVTAVYQLRWAEVTPSGVGPTQTLVDLDGTAGGLSGTDVDPSGCLDLGTGDFVYHTVAEAQQSTDWHLCFRRDAISVNGELGGPRGVTAVDIDRTFDPEEAPLAEVKMRTPESELARFDAVDLDALTDPALVYRGDRVISAFGTAWIDGSTSPPAPSNTTWLAHSAGGARQFTFYVESFDQPTPDAPGTVRLRVKSF